MKVCVLFLVVVICALLPSEGAAVERRPGFDALAKRAVDAFSRPSLNARIDRPHSRMAFDKLYAEFLTDDDDHEVEYHQQKIDEFLHSDDVEEFLKYLGVPMYMIDARLYEKYPELTKYEHDLVKTLSLISLAGYDIDVLFEDSSSEETDE